MKNNIFPIVLASVLIVLLVFLSDPFMLWMPSVAVTFIILAVVIVMIFWAGFILKERFGDERELIHRMNAGRVAYLSGLTVLTAALVVQGINHHLDFWVGIALMTMVISKLVVRIYLDTYH